MPMAATIPTWHAVVHGADGRRTNNGHDMAHMACCRSTAASASFLFGTFVKKKGVDGWVGSSILSTPMCGFYFL